MPHLLSSNHCRVYMLFQDNCDGIFHTPTYHDLYTFQKHALHTTFLKYYRICGKRYSPIRITIPISSKFVIITMSCYLATLPSGGKATTGQVLRLVWITCVYIIIDYVCVLCYKGCP